MGVWIAEVSWCHDANKASTEHSLICVPHQESSNLVFRGFSTWATRGNQETEGLGNLILSPISRKPIHIYDWRTHVIVKDVYPFVRLPGFWNPENRARNCSGNPETLIWTFCWWRHFLAHRNTYHLIDLIPWCHVRGLRQPKSTDSPRPLTSTDQHRCRTTTCPAGPLTQACTRFFLMLPTHHWGGGGSGSPGINDVR